MLDVTLESPSLSSIKSFAHTAEVPEPMLAFLDSEIDLITRVIKGRDLLQRFYDQDLRPLKQNFSCLQNFLGPREEGFLHLRLALRDAVRVGLLGEDRDTGAYYPPIETGLVKAIFPPTETEALSPEMLTFAASPVTAYGLKAGLTAGEVVAFLGGSHTLTEAYSNPNFYEAGHGFNHEVRAVFETVADNAVSFKLVTKALVPPCSQRPHGAEEYYWTLAGLKCSELAEQSKKAAVKAEEPMPAHV